MRSQGVGAGLSLKGELLAERPFVDYRPLRRAVALEDRWRDEALLVSLEQTTGVFIAYDSKTSQPLYEVSICFTPKTEDECYPRLTPRTFSPPQLKLTPRSLTVLAIISTLPDPVRAGTYVAGAACTREPANIAVNESSCNMLAVGPVYIQVIKWCD